MKSRQSCSLMSVSESAPDPERHEHLRVAEIIEGEGKSEGEGVGEGEEVEGKSSAGGGIYWPVFGATMALAEQCQKEQPEVEGTALRMAIEKRRDAALAAHGLQQVMGLMEDATAVTFRELRDSARRSIAVTCGGETLPLVISRKTPHAPCPPTPRSCHFLRLVCGRIRVDSYTPRARMPRTSGDPELKYSECRSGASTMPFRHTLRC